MPRGDKGRTSLPERVAQIYYTHGVFIAAHPFPVIATAIALVLLSCIPLVNLPLPSNVPQQYTEASNVSEAEVPRWYSASEPPLYIQQVILKSAVSPWVDGMLLTDAIRAPLAEAFRLVEAVQNYKHATSRRTLSDVCVRVEMPPDSSPLPQYNCLVVSPANFWRQDPHQFFTDTNLIATVYKYHSIQVGKVTLAELLFGIGLKEAGMKRYPLRNRQRVIQFAVTILLTKYDKEYMEGLHQHLRSIYPLHQNSSSSGQQSVVHLYYPGDFDFHEFLPLFFTYLMLFFYMYFSVRKIELVRSKVGMALSAVFTVISSLVMSIGLCLFFGLDPAGSSRGREVFPYLVVVVGLENILVLTKSVVSTQAHLDAKIRVAQGLSKEGWSITKNLLTEVTILTVGLLTLVPAIQEFCIFAMVGLLCDFFLQVCFFATVLSLDIRRIEAEDSGRRERGGPTTATGSSTGGAGGGTLRGATSRPPIPRSRSTPRLQYPPQQPQDVMPPPHHSLTKIPKRLQLVHFWASTRIVQRAFMLCMVVWIGGIVYSAGIIKNLVPLPESDISNLEPMLSRGRSFASGEPSGSHLFGTQRDHGRASDHGVHHQAARQGQVLLNYHWVRPLSPFKWCYLVGVYNGSVAGPCRLAILPPLRLQEAIPPARAAALRNPAEMPQKPFQWHSLAQALDPTDYSGDFDADSVGDDAGHRSWETPFLPTSPLEVLLVTALCSVSVLVIAYTALALYHCVCSRNYAQWRSAWGTSKDKDTTQIILQAMPLILEGHSQAVEWLATDGCTLASSCLAGEIIVWDATSGDKLTHIDRKAYFSSQMKKRNSLDCEDQVMSDYESGSPPSIKDNYMHMKRRVVSDKMKRETNNIRDGSCLKFPDLSSAMNFNFTNQSGAGPSGSGGSPLQHEDGFDYGPTIRQLYLEMAELDGCWKECEEEADSLEGGEGYPKVWCLDSLDNLIAVGTSAGTVEFWQATTGKFKCIFDDNCGVGITCIKMVGYRVVAARLNGALEVFSIEWGAHYGQPTYRRSGHVRAQSAGRAEDLLTLKGGDDLCCFRESSVRAHHQPITVLQVESTRVITGSHDHTLKVFSLVDQLLIFTLHGHCGPITALFIDSLNPLTAGSGSQDGMLCVWDLLTGACVYSLDAHDGPVVALTYSLSYVISLGSDERLCVWDRFQGHLLNTIQVPHTYCTSMTMLTHHLLIASKQGSLVVWDVRTGEPVRMVKLGHCDGCVFVRSIVQVAQDAVACDYANQLRIVRFPLVTDKLD